MKDINPSCDIKCDICKEGEWCGVIYLSSTYWEFVCGARLCSDCAAVIEATLDELSEGSVSENMRTDNWGRVKVVCDVTGPAFGPKDISALRAMGHIDDGGRIPLGIYPAHASPCVSSLRDEGIITETEEEEKND